MPLEITGLAEADDLLNEDGTALLIGMLLDQQVPMEWAFRGPHTIRERLGEIDAAVISQMDVDDVVALCASKPAIHRFPASMGRRIHALCVVIADQYQGRGENVWRTASSGAELAARLQALPGFGDEKTKIFVALLAKRMGVALPGWEEAAGVFADSTPRSAADVDGPDALAAVRRWKRHQRQKGRSKQD